MPLWALSEAERQGYTSGKKFLAETMESLLGSRDKLMISKIFPNPADPPDPRPQGRGLNMGLPFLAIAAQSLPSLTEGQKQSLKLIAEEIVKKQQPDGSWEFFTTLRRPPINESQTTDVAWIIMALEGATGPDAPESQRAVLSRAIAWLDAAKRSDIHQDKVLKVLLGARSAKSRKAMQTAIDELLALQRADGGWSQTVPERKSDAFATGQTLYALSIAGDTAERPEIQRGIDFLVATQKPDGSWPMISRSTPDGSPGSAKLLTPITCAASSWATLALARLRRRGERTVGETGSAARPRRAHPPGSSWLGPIREPWLVLRRPGCTPHPVTASMILLTAGPGRHQTPAQPVLAVDEPDVTARGSFMLGKIRFSIAWLMGVILVAGIGFAALRNPSEDWAGAMLLVTVGAVMIVAAGALCRGREERAGWLGFALFGGGYLVLAHGMAYSGKPLPTITLVQTIIGNLGAKLGPSSRFRTVDGWNELPTTYRILHCLWALALAQLGCVLAGVLVASPDARTPVSEEMARSGPRFPPLLRKWPALIGLAAFWIAAIAAVLGRWPAPGLWAGMSFLLTCGLLGTVALGAAFSRGRDRAAWLARPSSASATWH